MPSPMGGGSGGPPRQGAGLPSSGGQFGAPLGQAPTQEIQLEKYHIVDGEDKDEEIVM